MTSERPADSHPPASTPADDWQDGGSYSAGAPEHDFAVRRVTLIVLLPLIGAEACVICPRPKSKVCALIWHSAGRAGQSGSEGPPGALGDRRN